jgi:glucose/mannose transport system substrate-binding protein
MLVAPDLNGAMQDVITNFWNKNESADDAQKAFVSAMKGA